MASVARRREAVTGWWDACGCHALHTRGATPRGWRLYRAWQRTLRQAVRTATTPSFAGTLRAVYVPWVVEVGFRVNGDHPDAGQHVRLAAGTAKWVPNGETETELLLETPDLGVQLSDTISITKAGAVSAKERTP